jgi:hypothetical protein
VGKELVLLVGGPRGDAYRAVLLAEGVLLGG